MNSTWDKALISILKYEGGYVNDPLDAGGETNMGITKATLDKAIREGIVDKSTTVKALTKDQVSKIYKSYYWDAYQLDNYVYPIDFIVFDTVVNHGAKGMSRIVQRALNDFGENVKVDGIWGPITAAAVKNACIANPLLFADIVLQNRKLYYDSIIESKPSQIKFKKGWYNRLKNLAKDTGTKSPV